jgi:hypothetical protein
MLRIILSIQTTGKGVWDEARDWDWDWDWG